MPPIVKFAQETIDGFIHYSRHGMVTMQSDFA